ncbi:MAG: hypothetical protein ABL999_01870 [Pyrinomonadaceae bacterium]
MLRNYIVVVLIGLVCSSAILPASYANSIKSPRFANDSASKVKKTVSKIGTGKNAKVTVQMLDDKKIKGYISSMENDLFTVTSDSGLDTKIRYDQVKFLNRRGLGIG